MDNDYGTDPGLMMRRIMVFVTVIVVIFCAYLIVSAIIIAETTGVLKISSTQQATISVGRLNKQAKIIGKPGKAQVHLKPGTYQIMAITGNGQVAVRTVSIQKKRSVEINLNPITPLKLPSVSSVSFSGISTLTDLGVGSDQINTLKLNFFQFKTSAGSVSINTGSAQSAPHLLGDPFVITFNVSVDSQAYKARITYSDDGNIQLQLYNPGNGKLVYDSFADSEDVDYVP